MSYTDSRGYYSISFAHPYHFVPHYLHHLLYSSTLNYISHARPLDLIQLVFPHPNQPYDTEHCIRPQWWSSFSSPQTIQLSSSVRLSLSKITSSSLDASMRCITSIAYLRSKYLEYSSLHQNLTINRLLGCKSILLSARFELAASI